MENNYEVSNKKGVLCRMRTMQYLKTIGAPVSLISLLEEVLSFVKQWHPTCTSRDVMDNIYYLHDLGLVEKMLKNNEDNVENMLLIVSEKGYVSSLTADILIAHSHYYCPEDKFNDFFKQKIETESLVPDDWKMLL